MKNIYLGIKVISLCVIMVIVAAGLSGCGNTVKGIGTDIVTMGEDWMKDDNKIKETTNEKK